MTPAPSLCFCLGVLSIVEILYYCVAVYFSLQFCQCLLPVQTIWLTMTQFVIFILYNDGTVIHISRNSTSVFDFSSFPRLVLCSTILSNRSKPQFPITCVITGVNHQYTYIHFVPIQLFYYIHSLQQSINHTRYSTLW